MLDELDLVRTALADTEGECSGVARARSHLLTAIADERTDPLTPLDDGRVPARGSNGQRRPRWMLPAAIGAAAAIAAAVIVPLVPGRSAPAGASQILLAAANQALSATTPVPGPGQFYYSKTVQRVLDGMGSALPNGNGSPIVLYEHTVTVQLWATASGSGREAIDYGQTVPATPAFRQLWQDEGAHTLPGPHRFTSTLPLPPDAPKTQGLFTSRSGGGVPFGDLATLPTDPAALEQHIVTVTDHGDSDSVTIFFAVATLLGEDGSPALRSALFQVLSTLPGITNLGTVTAFNGLPATTVGITTTRGTGPMMQELLFDPTTSQIVERRAVLSGTTNLHTPGSPALMTGFVMGETDYVSSGIASSTTATPTQTTT